jgi:ADP-dependent NAD(P)H-hydrate dehydratase / NAD(P)H-hydrate epimerase
VQTVDIGIPAEAQAQLPLDLLTSAWTRDHLPSRPLNSNKGTFGKVLTVVGSINYVGAAYLSAASAYRSGAGLVTVALPRSIQGMILSLVPEATFLPLPEEDGGMVGADIPELREALPGYDALLVGCGVGQRPNTQQFIRNLLYGLDESGSPGVVVDADGLNALAATPDWHERFRLQAVLTPHPGEFGRLAGLSVAEVQADRIGHATRAAKDWQKIVVLKGAHTVIAMPDGRAMLSPFANAALATAGTGDVLAGLLGTLLAAGLSPFDAGSVGALVHGVAGGRASAGGPLRALKVAHAIPEAVRELLTRGA